MLWLHYAQVPGALYTRSCSLRQQKHSNSCHLHMYKTRCCANKKHLPVWSL